MSHIWTFSPSSEPYLQRVLEAASRVKSDNKWTEKFGKKTSDLSENTCIIIDDNTAPTSPVQEEANHVSFTDEDFFETIENETFNLSLICKECEKNPDLTLKMTKKLSNNATEKLFRLIFEEKDKENAFIQQFLIDFYTNYVKYQYSLLCIDLLIKINEIYPETFFKLLEILFNDTEITPQLLNNYTTMLNVENLTNFIENLHNINISSAGFVHNLLTIYTVYKDCIKNDTVQSFIKNCLIRYSESCRTDRNYGRIFMIYLQAEKNLEREIDEEVLRKTLDDHNSPFKRPCLLLFKELCGDDE